MSAKGCGKAQNAAKPQGPGKGWAASSQDAILGSVSRAQRGGRKEQSPTRSPMAMVSPAVEIEAPLSPALVEANSEAITKPILAAIEGFRSMLMVRVEHLSAPSSAMT